MRSFFSVLAVVLLLLALLGWLILGQGISQHLVPNPESVVQSFVINLSAGRYDPARSQLSDDLKREMTVEALQQLDQALSQQYGGYEFELGGQEQKQGTRAQYRARIKTERSGVREVTFELQQDPRSRIWQISALDELKALAEQ